MSQAIPVSVSLMRSADEPFVASCWKRSYRDAPQNAPIPEPKYYAAANPYVDRMLDNPDVTVLVARDPERPDTLLGFAAIELRGRTLALHYAYTRRSHRRLGVCTELLRYALQGASDADTLVYTARTRFDELWERWGFTQRDVRDWMRGAA